MIFNTQTADDFWFLTSCHFFDICSNGVEQLYFCVDQFFPAIATGAVEHLPFSQSFTCSQIHMAYFPNSCNCDFYVAKSQFPENMLCNGDWCHHGLHKWLFRYSPNSLSPDFKISSAIFGHPKAHASIKGVNPFWFFVSTGEPKLIRSFAHSNDPLAQASCSGMKPEKKIIFVRSSFWFGYL